MALDLHVNNERISNNSVFYRIKNSSSAYNLTVKLKDTVLTTSQLKTFLSDAKITISVNSDISGSIKYNSSFVDTIFGENGLLGAYTVPSTGVTSIRVRVHLNDEQYTSQTPEYSFEMFAVFVSSFPVVTFNCYPSAYIDEKTNALIYLNDNNWKLSPAVQFYGEGHTETMNLLAELVYSSNDYVINWFVGNNSIQLNNEQKNSLFVGNDSFPETKPDTSVWKNINSPILFPSTSFTNSILSITSVTQRKSTVTIPSFVNENADIPVSVRVTTKEITLSGPIVTYDDVTGHQSFYPFFNSSLNIYGYESRQRYKGNIKVLTYPSLPDPVFFSPFDKKTPFLPLDGQTHPFRSSVVDKISYDFLVNRFSGTEWKLTANSPNGSWETLTPFLSTVTTYQFNMGYEIDQDWYLPVHRAAYNGVTSLVISCTAYKHVWINAPPYDWEKKFITYTYEDEILFQPYPFNEFRFYTPNYFNLKNQDILIYLTPGVNFANNINGLQISSKFGSNTITFNKDQLGFSSAYNVPLTGIMSFDVLGPMDLFITANSDNIVDNKPKNFVYKIPKFVEIVSALDETFSESIKTASNPLTLTYNEAPKIYPNEWITADNINSIFNKLYTSIQEVISYTTLYINKSFVYGQMVTQPLKNTNTKNEIYTWDDLQDNKNAVTSWETFATNKLFAGRYWKDHETQAKTQTEIDPTCIQKHCIDWRWKFRTQKRSSPYTTWRKTRKGGVLEKKWRREKCALDSDDIQCNRSEWLISTTPHVPFNVTENAACELRDVLTFNSKEIIVVYPTEIRVLDTDPKATTIARRGIADDEYSFQDIVSLGITSDNKIVILDKMLSRVSVFDLIQNPAEIIPFLSWGTYGIAQDPRGFYDPLDLYVDQHDGVYIADTGNKCVKKLSVTGNLQHILTHTYFNEYPPLSICKDSNDNLHCLTETRVLVFSNTGNYITHYNISSTITNPKKIRNSFNKEFLYITHEKGMQKIFKNGNFAYDMIPSVSSKGCRGVFQDKFRNLFVTSRTSLLKVPDIQQTRESKMQIPPHLIWNLDEILVSKEEYIQSWVYLKSFHRLWDNIELLRDSLYYEKESCKSYKPPVHKKEDLIIGQNELVTNSVINRLSNQLWENLVSLLEYFNLDCKK